MGKIKSALEIALERTESVKSDKSSIGQFEAKQKGKKLANDFLEGAADNLEANIKKTPKEDLQSLKQGIFDVLISQIALPTVKEDLKRIEKAGSGLKAIIGVKRFDETVKQLFEILNQFINESSQYEEAIKRQYAPKLRQKEEEISRRMGRQVKLDAYQDPEFVHFLSQNMNALKANYQTAIDQVRDEAFRLFEKNTSQ